MAKDFDGSIRRFAHPTAKEPAVSTPCQTFETPRDADRRNDEQKILALAAVVFWALIFTLAGAYLA